MRQKKVRVIYDTFRQTSYMFSLVPQCLSICIGLLIVLLKTGPAAIHRIVRPWQSC